MDCLLCGNEIASACELLGFDVCRECRKRETRRELISMAREEVEDLMIKTGDGALTCAMTIQDKYDLSDSDVDDVAHYCWLHTEKEG